MSFSAPQTQQSNPFGPSYGLGGNVTSWSNPYLASRGGAFPTTAPDMTQFILSTLGYGSRGPNGIPYGSPPVPLTPAASPQPTLVSSMPDVAPTFSGVPQTPPTNPFGPSYGLGGNVVPLSGMFAAPGRFA